ncbi:MAG: hypothetical protein M3P34_05925 [Actinomycetota bacterium]|nr:hypothetical protein [Actinomycetota bacterium]
MADYERCVDLIEDYADLGLGFVDASIVAVAESHGVRDHRHAESARSPDRAAPPL